MRFECSALRFQRLPDSRQIGDRRAGTRFAKARASDIDSDVRFNGVGDMLRYLPRAAVIGFFAPFPSMWFQSGNFGLAGRLVSGVETLAMYLLYVAIGFCLWRERKNAKVWFLFLVAAIGMVALGLVVVNAGALFRIRYTLRKHAQPAKSSVALLFTALCLRILLMWFSSLARVGSDEFFRIEKCALLTRSG